MKILQFYATLLATSIRASMANRTAFFIEASLAMVNTLIFFCMWLVFFKEFRSIGNWQQNDMRALIAIVSGAYGLLLVFFGGTRLLANYIVSGQLDAFLTQPKHVLLNIAGSKSAPKGWGSLVTTAVLMAWGDIFDLQTIVLILVALITGCMVYTSIRIIAHSLTFWLGPTDGLCDKYADSLYLFAFYPTNIYSGALQCIMFTLIPAGVIGFLPIELIRDFTWTKLLVLLASASIFPCIATYIFNKGLKRYESGNQFALRN
ncbi:MAG: ABC-2 family transporter protein [Chlamydiales bacterium]|nr:ABC-2 family transporter protein [Chlamydiales bacterium]